MGDDDTRKKKNVKPKLYKIIGEAACKQGIVNDLYQDKM